LSAAALFDVPDLYPVVNSRHTLPLSLITAT